MTRAPGRVTALAAALLALGAGGLAAQDTVRVIGRYTPGSRPGIIVLAAPGLDSARAIVQRDLDYSDRFEAVSGADRPAGNALNYGLYKSMGATYALELVPATGGVTVRLHDVGRGTVRNQTTAPAAPAGGSVDRMALHRLSDEVVRWATGSPGYAASRLLFLGTDGRVYRIDSDGADLTPVTPAGTRAFSPAWAPDGRRFAYTRMQGGKGPIVVQPLDGGPAATVPGTGTGLNFSAAFSPDGRTVAYAHLTEDGTDVYSGNVADQCCAQRLTVGRFADNLSPTFSPDGRRIAFISTRAGTPQLYVMGADGTEQDVLAPFDYGDTGPSNAPEWSPDGANVVFHREVSRAPQVFVVDVARQRVKQVTSGGRNTDPTWAPDGRHVAFVSDRSGRLQLWVIDLESGRVRQLSTPGAVRLPAWSRRLGG
ncbi:MAG TPA: DPP IV N-terminal domain-containing protein [Gemmatimonadales bacterium]|nr:DPP IV N-terminal domain-containing protein [Gemmatimonadales bacterium]